MKSIICLILLFFIGQYTHADPLSSKASDDSPTKNCVVYRTNDQHIYHLSLFQLYQNGINEFVHKLDKNLTLSDLRESVDKNCPKSYFPKSRYGECYLEEYVEGGFFVRQKVPSDPSVNWDHGYRPTIEQAQSVILNFQEMGICPSQN